MAIPRGHRMVRTVIGLVLIPVGLLILAPVALFGLLVLTRQLIVDYDTFIPAYFVEGFVGVGVAALGVWFVFGTRGRK